MATTPKPPKERDGIISALNVAIETLNLAMQISSPTPAKAVFGSASVLLTMIRDSMANESDYTDLALFCAEVCKTLYEGLKGKRLDKQDQSVLRAIGQLATTVAEIQRKVTKLGKRGPISQLLHARSDKDAIASWRQQLYGVLHIFNTKLAMNTNTLVAGLYRNKADQEDTGDNHSAQASIPTGESPPPPPRACFGRDELIEEVVGLAENLNPVALIGPGGIGKTSIALKVLHHDRMKQRFGDDRRFIRCDEFPPSRANFLRRLSKVMGIGVENPEDLSPLRPSLSSRKTLLILDNGESILDPEGDNAEEIYEVVEELSQFDNICLVITSRIATIPPDCENLEVPPLSMEAARDAFHRIYKCHGRLVDDILEQLDFHPLSVTLLATVAQQNKWNTNRLSREWEQRQTSVLRAQHKSLAAAIELSIASPTFRELGPEARELLGVIAFLPRGVSEDNFHWLFPTVPDGNIILDKFCVLSLTYRNDGFVTMLAPLRDYLRPDDPTSSPLLRTTKNCYFTRLSMSAPLDPQRPGFNDTRWISSEDMNVEHLLDVLVSADANAEAQATWDACLDFINHLAWHKPRFIVLGSRIEGLPDGHRSKSACLFQLSWLFNAIGNRTEQKRLLTHCLGLVREEGDDHWIAAVLMGLSDANRMLSLHGEGIHQSKEALGIYERLGDIVQQAECLNSLSRLFRMDGRLDAAEEAASRAITLLPEKGQEYRVCRTHRALGEICKAKMEIERAIHHFEMAIGIASPFNWHSVLFWNHYGLARLLYHEQRFDDAQTNAYQAKSHAVGNPYHLGRAAELQARIWYLQHQLEDAMSEALRALEIYEKLGASEGARSCRALLNYIREQ